MNQNETQSGQAPQAPLTDPFDESMRILSDIPTERAMKELSQTGAKMPSVRQSIETMALWKESLIKTMRFLHARVEMQKHIIEMHEVNTKTDKVIARILRELGSDYEIVKKDDKKD